MLCRTEIFSAFSVFLYILIHAGLVPWRFKSVGVLKPCKKSSANIISSFQIYEGTAQIQRMIIAREHVGKFKA